MVMNGEDLPDRAVLDAYTVKGSDLQDYLTKPARHELKCFVTVLSDPRGLESPGNARMGLLPDTPEPVSRSQLLGDPLFHLRYQLFVIRQRIAMRLPDAWIPALHLDFGVLPVLEAFGCALTEGGGSTWAKPVISSPEQGHDLQPDFSRPRCREILSAARVWLERTGGALPISAGGVHGPLSCAAQILGVTEFLTAFYTHPSEVHHLLDTVTAAIIRWMELLEQACGHRLRGAAQYHVPSREGIFAGEDELVLISAEHFRQFGVPPLSELSRAFGGIFVHFCGGSTHNLEGIRRIPGIRGVDSQFTPDQFVAARRILGPDVLILTRVRNRPAGAGDLSLDYLQQYLALARRTRTLLWLFADSPEQATQFCGMVLSERARGPAA